jgi:hypothetical protein
MCRAKYNNSTDQYGVINVEIETMCKYANVTTVKMLLPGVSLLITILISNNCCPTKCLKPLLCLCGLTPPDKYRDSQGL